MTPAGVIRKSDDIDSDGGPAGNRAFQGCDGKRGLHARVDGIAHDAVG